jgi:DNA polymerase III delta prime subunit
MISFQQFRLNLKEALSLTDPLAQSTLKITDKSSLNIMFEFNFDNNKYNINIYNTKRSILLDNKELDELNLMYISLQVNNSYALTNKLGMQANIIYNMLLNAIKQAHDHFGENNIHGYRFSSVDTSQELMYDRLMKRFAPNLITWDDFVGIHLKPESIQKLKDKNPDLIEEINNQIYQANSKRERNIQQSQQNKKLQRSLRRQQP